MKPWTKKQIEQHRVAGEKLALIKQEFYSYILENTRIRKEIDEKSCIQFIKNAYKKHRLINDTPKESCIVAFGEHTREVHYFPTQKTNSILKPNSLILLDIWARLDEKEAPYADATFMFYYGNKIPKEIQASWEVLMSARDTALQFLSQKLKRGVFPRGLDIDRAAHDVIGEAGFGRGIKHTIGHSLGFESPHGKLPGINWREYKPLLKNVGYTIEPGIYLNSFGMRSEIDFYIDDTEQVIITTPIQKEIEIL